MKISEYINANYDVIYQNKNYASFDDVEEFYLGEDHGNPGDDAINCEFINSYADEKDVVIVEAVKSMQIINPDDSYQSVNLKTKAVIMGGDLGDIREILGSDFATEMGDFERRLKILQKRLESEPNKQESIKQEFIELSKRLFMKAFISPPSLEDQKKLTAKITETFPERLKFFMDTLNKVQDQFHKKFIINGKRHLITEDMLDKPDVSLEPTSDEENFEDSIDFPEPKVSLDVFYEFLKSRKAVVLIPKAEKAEERSMQENPLFSEMIALSQKQALQEVQNK